MRRKLAASPFLTLAVALLTAAASVGADAGEGVDRAMWFVERSMEATELLNEGKAAEALPILEELVGQYGALDGDGYAAMSLGDCLAMLGRAEEARRVYGGAAAGHAALRGAVEEKVTELDLAEPVSEALIERLRGKAEERGDEREYLAAWHLGRALQKKALGLLEEAAACFQRAGGRHRGVGRVTGGVAHGAVLAELSGELGAAIEELEGRWLRYRLRPAMFEEALTDFGGLRRDARSRAEWTVEAPDGGRAVCRLGADGEGEVCVTVDGRRIALTRDEAALIELHRERIEAIVGEAVARDAASRHGLRP